ncbi:hypothetical protein PAXINDRAFT_19080 [Paxillus involutus ATCC 200175]|uniref:Uncharacterized protein n=1 Tax=Paxillus involutus ATCC 200175 TaxID=664439 RepID=A0A0C9SND9_PAXIN|nr:hypothetical protein PAXINDRAFT_19080 [Paxillus involutus ATCC 200175]
MHNGAAATYLLVYGTIGVSHLPDHLGRNAQRSSVDGQAWKVPLGSSPQVTIYWALAFTIVSTVPQFSDISALVSAVCVFQFTYTFGYIVQIDAMSGD